MERHAERLIRFDALANFRDLGGWTTATGRRVRTGRLYRADNLGKLAEGTEDWSRFLALGVRTVVDLRHPWEIEANGRVPEHPAVTYHNLSIEHRPYDQAALTPDIEPGPYLAERYLEVAEDGRKEIRRALELVAETARAGDPLVFHCTSGKDRTGLLAALVLTLLDVPRATVVEDFARTDRAAPALLAAWTARNPGRTPAWPSYGRAPAEVMETFLTHLTTRYGSVPGYLTEALSLDTPALTADLRAHLLD
ncbi:tyrosine-protein phosphatase [Streptomyces sp. NPDC003717]|uniref:tyrosine-protein phosphatase n=1 Tax=Streptomyces sp. NPDC003717 TaxID=3154276 RepID=UPI0033AB3CE5